MKVTLTSNVVLKGKVAQRGTTIDLDSKAADQLVQRGLAEAAAKAKTEAKTENDGK